MLFDKRVVIVTPAGRKRYLELLIPQLLNLRSVVDEYVLWVNTTNEIDIEYMKNVAQAYPDFIKLQWSKIPINGNLSIGHFFRECVDANTVYVRFDDDVVYIDTIEAFVNFIKFRIEHPEYFIIYANILNNSVISHIHQRLGNFNLEKGIAGYKADNPIGWGCPSFAYNLHTQILQLIEEKGSLKTFYIQNWKLFECERVSINCISWLGSTFKEFNGQVTGIDEEEWLSVTYPKMNKCVNCVFGHFVCVHYAFCTQRSYLDTTDLLEKYDQLMKKQVDKKRL